VGLAAQNTTLQSGSRSSRKLAVRHCRRKNTVPPIDRTSGSRRKQTLQVTRKTGSDAPRYAGQDQATGRGEVEDSAAGTLGRKSERGAAVVNSPENPTPQKTFGPLRPARVNFVLHGPAPGSVVSLSIRRSSSTEKISSAGPPHFPGETPGNEREIPASFFAARDRASSRRRARKERFLWPKGRVFPATVVIIGCFRAGLRTALGSPTHCPSMRRIGPRPGLQRPMGSRPPQSNSPRQKRCVGSRDAQPARPP